MLNTTKEICRTCNKIREFGFFRNKNNKCFLCRECNTEFKKRYRLTQNGKEKTKNAVYKSIDKLRYKQNARVLLHYYIKTGQIKKPNKCSKCKKRAKLEGHHEDYSKPLEVIWCCKTCHRMLDKSLQDKYKLVE